RSRWRRSEQGGRPASRPTNEFAGAFPSLLSRARRVLALWSQQVVQAHFRLGFRDEFTESVGVAEHAQSAGDVAKFNGAVTGLDLPVSRDRHAHNRGDVFLGEIAAQAFGAQTRA